MTYRDTIAAKKIQVNSFLGAGVLSRKKYFFDFTYTD